MAEILILCGLALIMSQIYSRTKKPKLYALLNTSAGVGVLLLARILINGGICINNFSCALSGILGVPGAILVSFIEFGG